jgi:DNA-binding CsgD family transcriptional regulator
VLIGDIAGERPAARDPLQQLTERERQVLRLTVEGKSSAASAKSLGLSPKTVESYRSRLMRKLEIHDTPGLVKFAIRYGLASLE